MQLSFTKPNNGRDTEDFLFNMSTPNEPTYSHASSSNYGGPAAKEPRFFKTKICKHFLLTGGCPRGDRYERERANARTPAREGARTKVRASERERKVHK